MSRLLDPFHRRLIESIGVEPGTRTLEVGCGNGSMSAWLAELVAPGGHAVAVDIDLSLAAGRPGLELRRHDILSGPVEPRDFDLWSPRGPCSITSPTQGRRSRTCWPAWPRGRGPPHRAGLPAGRRRRAAGGPRVLGRLARLGPGPGHRLRRRPIARPAPRGARHGGDRRLGGDGDLQRRLTLGRLLEADGRRAARGPARLWRAERRPGRGLPRTMRRPTWWTQTIAFTAVRRAGRGDAPARGADSRRISFIPFGLPGPAHHPKG